MPPNIILVTVDCWRGDHIGVADSPQVVTPHLDRLANQSHYFSDAYSCGGWTKIAMTALFSSTYASMFGFAQGKLSDDRPLLAEQLKEAGYTTAGFTTNPVCGGAQGFNRGFDYFHDLKPNGAVSKWSLAGLLRRSRLKNKPLAHRVLALMGLDSRPPYHSKTADQLVDAGLDWLAMRDKQPEGEPYFLWLHFMDLHWPYRSSSREVDGHESCEMWRDRNIWQRVKKSRGQYYPGDKRADRWRRLYAEETASLDQSLGRFFDAARKRKDWNNTAVCVTSDHAEELYEHGTWAHSWNQLYAEGTHVPLIIKLPEQASSVRHDQVVSHLDVTPTLLELAGVKPSEKMMGNSLFSVDKEGKALEKIPVLLEMLGHRDSLRYRLAVRYLGYLYIYDGDNDQCLLFLLEKDPKCTNNLYQKGTEPSGVFDRLRLVHIAKGALDVLKGMTILGEDEMLYDLDDDPEVVERLRALGYID